MAAPIYRYPFTGDGVAIAASVVAPASQEYRVISVTLNLDAANAVSELFTITHNAMEGPIYDVLLYAVDLSVGATVHLVWQPERDYYIKGGDSLDIAWPNGAGQGVTEWGLLVTLQGVGYASGA